MITGKQLADAAVAAIPMGITYQQEDCQKFVKQSVKRAGGDMGNYAGSNDMFRNACSKMYPLSMATPVLGCVLFIVAEGYNKKYDDSLGDASHVGIYTGNPEVVHSSATRGGVFPSTLKNGWTHVGWLKAVDYVAHKGDTGAQGESREVVKMLHRVILPTADAGQTVNLRKNADPNSVVLARVPDGAEVLAADVFDAAGQMWQPVTYNGQSGYMMARYLMAVTDLPAWVPLYDGIAALPETVEERLLLAEKRIANLEKVTGVKFGG